MEVLERNREAKRWREEQLKPRDKRGLAVPELEELRRVLAPLDKGHPEKILKHFGPKIKFFDQFSGKHFLPKILYSDQIFNFLPDFLTKSSIF